MSYQQWPGLSRDSVPLNNLFQNTEESFMEGAESGQIHTLQILVLSLMSLSL